MIRALVLRLEGPLQSWGGPVAGNDRPSLDVPTKSGVIGLCAGALGIERGEVERLASLHTAFALAVRVDRRGTPGVDYHTTLDVPTADGKIRKDAVISKRRYLYDAAFTALLVARADTAPTLEEIAAALPRPRFAPFLGRRACVPAGRVFDRGPIAGADWRALLDQVPAAERADPSPHEVHLDAELVADDGPRQHRQRDVLIGRLPRLFGERMVHVSRWTPPAPSSVKETIDSWMP